MKKVLEYVTNLCYSLFRIGYWEVINMEENKLTVFDVANFFRSKEKMSHKKLQKLVYYAYSWYVALYNEDKDNIKNKLFDDCHFEAWVHGPVCPELYYHFSDNYGFVDKYHGRLNQNITGEIKRFLESIYKTFGKYTGDQLEVMTHRELPWQNARDNLPAYEPSNKTILESDMFKYYNSI